jgi:hypothetical protein
MLKDVIVDSIKSYVGFMKFISFLILPMLLLVYMYAYILDMLSLDISYIIYISITWVGFLLITVLYWIWMNIVAYLKNNYMI